MTYSHQSTNLATRVERIVPLQLPAGPRDPTDPAKDSLGVRPILSSSARSVRD